MCDPDFGLSPHRKVSTLRHAVRACYTAAWWKAGIDQVLQNPHVQAARGREVQSCGMQLLRCAFAGHSCTRQVGVGQSSMNSLSA